MGLVVAARKAACAGPDDHENRVDRWQPEANLLAESGA
jgi:hypothetical protein